MTEPVSIADGPTVPGLSFRRFAGPDDYPRMLAVINACKTADQSERSDTVEDIARTYSHLTNCDPRTDMLFAEMEGRPIGYSRVQWWQETDGPRIYMLFGFLDPSWRRRGVGTAMLRHNERRIREIAAGHPEVPKFFQSWASRQEAGTNALLLAEGYQPITYEADMVRPHLADIPEASLPEGLELRPVTEDQLRTIWEAATEAFRDHWGYSEPTEEDYQAFLEFPHQDLSLWRVAWEGAQVAGQVRSFINQQENEEYRRKRGYTEDISTARRWRRRGVAKALIAASLAELRERGMTEAALGVHTENPNGAFQLYEGLGYRVVKLQTTYRKPLG
ncbi:MAG: GNAT family N-acetyltransferase [Acidimicrobiia bacterium]